MGRPKKKKAAKTSKHTTVEAATAEARRLAQLNNASVVRHNAAVKKVARANSGRRVRSGVGARSQPPRSAGGDLPPVEAPLNVSEAHLDTLVRSFRKAWVRHGNIDASALTHDSIAEIGRRAGEHAAARALWQQHLGAGIDTEAVTDLLGVTRQALDSRKRTGSVLALPGERTTHYPTWQFDTSTTPPTVRPITLRIVTTFREAVDDISPFTIAAWATSPQPELDDRSPADWIIHGGQDAPVVLAAQRAAHLEAV